MPDKYSNEQLLIFGLLVLTILEGIAHFGQIYPDSFGYVAVARHFEGSGADSGAFRLLRPVVPLASAMLNHFLDIRAAFAVVNLLMWGAASVLMYLFAKSLSERVDTAFLASAYFTSSVPTLFFGGAVLTDMAGYFFVLLGAYVVVNWNLPKASIQRVGIASAIMTVGLLSRETVASVFFLAFVWALLSKGSLRKTALFVIIPIALALLWSVLVGVSYLDWAAANAAFQGQHQPMTIPQRLFAWLPTVVHAFRPEGIFLAFLGILQLALKKKLKVHFAILGGIGVFLLIAPGVLDYRYAFILFPSVLVLAGLGTTWLSAVVAEKALPLSPGSKRKLALALELAILIVYMIDTNRIALRVLSFPWKPYTDPMVSPIALLLKFRA